MINKTIGNGGNYATIGAAIVALNAASPLTDDYTFTLISDVTEGAHGDSFYDANGKTVTFTAAPHGGRLASAKKVALSAPQSGLDFGITNGNLIVENIHVDRTTTASQYYSAILYVDTGGIILRNCFFHVGASVKGGVCAIGTWGSTKICGCLLYGTICGGAHALELIGSNAVIENVTIFSCDSGVFFEGSNDSAVLRNVVTLDCPIGWDFGAWGCTATLINCADSGTSINNSLHKISCLSGIDTVSNMWSIIPTDPRFMVPKIQF